VSFGQRAESYLTALASGDHDRIQTAVNASFGECYAMTASGDVPEWQEVMERRVPIPTGRIPDGTVRLVAGVDVQKFSLYYVVRAFGGRGTSWLVDYGQLYGPTDQDEVWQSLTDLLLTPISGWQIERCGIDSGFRPNKKDGGEEHKVYEYCRRMSWLCYPTKGRDVQAQPYRVSRIEVKPDGKAAKYSINLVWLSSDFFKSLVMSRLRTPVDKPGALHIPENVTEDYARQITSEARIVVEGKPTWVRRSRDNHYLDCEAIAAAMGYSFNVQRIPHPSEARGAGDQDSDDDQGNDDPAGVDAPSTAAGEDDRSARGEPSAPAPAGVGGGGASIRNKFAQRSRKMNR